MNASYPLVLDWLSKASVGLSTMVDEHFGINIVEFMVSGVFFYSGLDTVLNLFFISGGRCHSCCSCIGWASEGHYCPVQWRKYRYVFLDASRSLLIAFVPRIGFHARTSQEFAEAMQAALTLSPEDELAIRWRARAWAVQRFSEEEFERGWNQSGWRSFIS